MPYNLPQEYKYFKSKGLFQKIQEICFKMGTRILKIEAKMAEIIEPEVGNPPLKCIKICHQNCKWKSGLSHILYCNLLDFLHKKESKVSFEILTS